VFLPRLFTLDTKVFRSSVRDTGEIIGVSELVNIIVHFRRRCQFIRAEQFVGCEAATILRRTAAGVVWPSWRLGEKSTCAMFSPANAALLWSLRTAPQAPASRGSVASAPGAFAASGLALAVTRRFAG